MKHLFLINPAAGSRDRTLECSREIAKLCKSLDYRVEISQRPGDCARLAREAAQSGEEYRIYACGGDGTLNEVAAGAAGYDNVAITVWVGGSGNDFVRLFSEPGAFQYLPRLLDAEEARFDLIRCNDALALNICSVGLDARIGTDVASYKRLPLLQGFWAYAASAVVNVVRGVSQPLKVTLCGETRDEEMTMVCVCNGRYYGGGFYAVPEADPRDGILDVLLVKKVTRAQVPGLIGKYKAGRYKELPEYITHYRTDHLEIHSPTLTAVNLDGELKMETDIHMAVAKEKVRFFYPKGLTW